MWVRFGPGGVRFFVGETAAPGGEGFSLRRPCQRLLSRFGMVKIRRAPSEVFLFLALRVVLQPQALVSARAKGALPRDREQQSSTLPSFYAMPYEFQVEVFYIYARSAKSDGWFVSVWLPLLPLALQNT